MKKLLYFVFTFIVQFSFGQNEKLIDYFKKDLKNSFNGRGEDFDINKYTNLKNAALPTKISIKYFNKFLEVIRIEALEQQETLEDLGTTTVTSIIYPVGKLKIKEKIYLFFIYDNGRSEFMMYSAIYQPQKNQIENVLKIMSGVYSEKDIYTFRYCKDSLITTTYKSIKKYDNKKKQNYFTYTFLNNYYTIYPDFKFIKKETIFSTFSNGTYDVYRSNSSPDDPVLVPCK